jgi:hypothetical protein
LYTLAQRNGSFTRFETGKIEHGRECDCGKDHRSGQFRQAWMRDIFHIVRAIIHGIYDPSDLPKLLIPLEKPADGAIFLFGIVIAKECSEQEIIPWSLKATRCRIKLSENVRWARFKFGRAECPNCP